MPIGTTTELDVARQAALAGGAIVARGFREGVTFQAKADAGLVSEADTDSERAIVECIHRDNGSLELIHLQPDQFCGIPRRRQGFGNDAGNWFANITDDVTGERRLL